MSPNCKKKLKGDPVAYYLLKINVLPYCRNVLDYCLHGFPLNEYWPMAFSSEFSFQSFIRGGFFVEYDEGAAFTNLLIDSAK